MASNDNQSSVPNEGTNQNSFDRKEHLYTNHFICSLHDNILLYQYDIAVEESDGRSQNWIECENRWRCTQVLKSLTGNNQLEPNVFVWYDDEKTLFSTSEISTPMLIPGHNRRYRLNIKSLSNQQSTSDINDYINDRTNVFPYDTVRIIEALLKRSLQGRVRIVRNNIYFLDEEYNQNEDESNESYGFKRRYGFNQELNRSSAGLTLNIQTKCTVFYSNISLLEFIYKQIRSDRMPTDNDYRKLTRILKNCSIVTDEPHWETKYRFEKFDYRRVYEIQLESGELLIDYYRNVKNLTLRQINYPCIQVHSQNNPTTIHYLPLEVCRIKDWQICHEPSLCVPEAGRYILTPEECYYQIMSTLYDCDYNTNPLCQAVGFHVDNEEMLDFDARILVLPTIKTGVAYWAELVEGEIHLGGRVHTHKLISNLAITYFGTNYNQNKDNIQRFTDILVEVMESYNLYYSGHKEDHIVPIAEHIDQYFCSMSEQKCQFIICLMDRKDEDELTKLRVNIKRCGTLLYGIMTQCVNYSEILSDEKSANDYCRNLIRKINFKNGGINIKLDLSDVWRNKKSPNDSYMYFGAALTSSTDVSRQYSTLAAIVGSGNDSCSTTAARVCKQYPKGDFSSIETIAGMTKMIEQLLDYNYEIRNEDEPFTKIRQVEIPAIRQAFDKIYGDQTNHPLLTFVVVKRRHNTRFFTYKPMDNQLESELNRISEETKNMPIGCVIDTTIVHPDQHNFYLNSHNSLLGMNHPPLYYVLLDEIGCTPDELQLLTYHLCYTDPRSTASEAVPSVLHQADVAVSNARDLFYSAHDSSIIDIAERSRILQNSTSNDCDYEFLQVHENLRNKPVLA
ncbi:unnamed protein product [Rotaria sordida]|uniref:Uncharacterized protein n=1 Tax=Rotaria sordida TaxID=392033 RepID=A0A815V549_9BILA|nr:unnamed protein product [Rotaria sordida]CAF1341882.1 unnamed protein product [Rotaria sordida]CAF1526022.1 unnamed protein product [Rotaria sordida]CAF4108211.1 unnamed protein product [Rotaria sordida]